MKSLLMRAKGYTYNEVQEEFQKDESGEMALVRRKVTEKYCPPDSAALKTYLELNRDASIVEMSDEELEKERQRLLEELKNLEDKK